MLDDLMYNTKKRIEFGLGILFITFLIIGIAWIVNYRYITTGTIIATNWELKIARQQYTTVAEDAWSVPYGGREYDRRWKYHYTYQSGTRTESYTTNESYSCGTSKKPKTCTRRVRKTRSVAVYSDQYDWRYYYYIDRWIDISPLSTSGNDKELVHWPDTTDGNYNTADVIGNVRLGNKWSHYWIVITAENKTYERDMVDSEWYTYAKNEKVKLTLGYFNNVISVEKKGF